MKTFCEYIEESVSTKKNFKEFDRLCRLISKNKLKWGETAPKTLYKWVDDLTKLINSHNDDWRLYCKEHGYDPSSNAHEIGRAHV